MDTRKCITRNSRKGSLKHFERHNFNLSLS